MTSREIFDQYDILLVDVFGVIWNGVDWISGALETLKDLVAKNKVVVILSNASTSSRYMLNKYAMPGAKNDEYFSEFITSGEVLSDVLRNHQLSFKSVLVPKTYTILGTKVAHIFENTSYKYTDSLDDADFVYVSIPQLTNSQKSLLTNDLQKMLRVSNMRQSDDIVWDSLSVEPFIPQLREILRRKKPLLVPNPDKFASVGVLDSPDDKQYVSRLVVRQGSLGEEYIKMGGEVYFIGKPYPVVYEFALKRAAKVLNKTLSDLSSLRIAMIGDTLETDILGAQNASDALGLKIDGILVDTGISYNELLLAGHDNVLSRLECYKTREIFPQHEVSSIALSGNVLF